ncbi:hypothetical protein IT575_10020 [bacterium]|nr:hypothetical protein [bacterium]
MRPGNQPCGCATLLAVYSYDELVKIVMEHPSHRVLWDKDVKADDILNISFGSSTIHFGSFQAYLHGHRGEVLLYFDANGDLLDIEICSFPKSSWSATGRKQPTIAIRWLNFVDRLRWALRI